MKVLTTVVEKVLDLNEEYDADSAFKAVVDGYYSKRERDLGSTLRSGALKLGPPHVRKRYIDRQRAFFREALPTVFKGNETFANVNEAADHFANGCYLYDREHCDGKYNRTGEAGSATKKKIKEMIQHGFFVIGE